MLRKIANFFHKILRHFYFRTATEYRYQEEQENAKCCHCGKRHNWDAYEGSVYRGKLLCPDCYQDYYGYCNLCGELHLYSDMNDDILCNGCEAFLTFDNGSDK